MFALASFVCRI